MSIGTLVVRLVLVIAVPAVVALVGFEVGYAVLTVSALAALFECVVTAVEMSSGGANPGKRRGGKERNMRPLKSFPLQLAVIYVVQMWFLLLSHASSSSSPEPAASPGNPAPVPAQVASGLAAVQTAEAVQPARTKDFLQNSAQLPAAAATPKSAPSPSGPRPWAKKPGEGYKVEEDPENLKWTPKTISVVLPCAEERDLAFKTVKSVWEMTPSDVLHEIVVVDDGSEPPLAQTHLTPEVQQKYKVLIKRHENTIGLIGAKKTGGDAATGDIVVFFDCHVGPQPNWHQDFLELIGQNYRRMVIPQITALDIDTWTQIGAGGGMSKCYVTWDGDFKWGGTDDMYMGMLSGGLAGLSKRWWTESGGYDSKMLGWGGENIDQGIRMWVLGGEIVAAPNAQVAHMWRTGAKGTNARYKRVGDTMFNRARAMKAWMGEFTAKLDDFPSFSYRKNAEGDGWTGDMSTFEKVKDNLGGARPFAWYLRRFKVVYEDAGLLPHEIYMLKDESTGKCLLFQGQAGTSGSGREGIVLDSCDQNNHRFYWHPGNRSPKSGKCCSGMKAWNTDQCVEGGQGGGKAVTGICEIGGHNGGQYWRLHSDGTIQKGGSCLGPDGNGGIEEAPCLSFRSRGGAKFTKVNAHKPLETELYEKAQRDHPETFAKLDAELKAQASAGPGKCKESGVKCMTLIYASSGPRKCLDDEAGLTQDMDSCAVAYPDGNSLKLAERGDCLDTKSDSDPESYVWYGCHGGENQIFELRGSRYCAQQGNAGDQCFDVQPYP